ncbi:MAG: hypothetical protein MZU79_04605 [Anaerotruncus sp.]|nr:hypothetical protein [Anaerotruncus sp.]
MGGSPRRRPPMTRARTIPVLAVGHSLRPGRRRLGRRTLAGRLLRPRRGPTTATMSRRSPCRSAASARARSRSAAAATCATGRS